MYRALRSSFAALAMALIISTGAFGREPTFSEFVREAISESSAIADARESVSEALDALSPGFDFDAVKLSISGSGRFNNTGAAFTDAVSPEASANLSIPIIPQISFGAQISTNFDTVSSNYSLSISPFSDPKVTYRERQTYELAALQLISVSVSVPYQIEQSLYNLIMARKSAAISYRKLELEEEQFALSRELYELGDLSWSEYNTATEAYSTAQRNVFDAERSELSARKQLADLVGVTLADTGVVEPTIEELEAEIDARRSRVASESDSATTTDVITARIQLRALEGELKATPVFEPTLSFSAGANLPFSSASASVSLSLSSSQYNGDERASLKADIADQLDAIDNEMVSLAFELDMLKRQIESAERLYDSSVASVETARLTYEETAYLYDAGDRTDLQLAEAEVSLESAQQSRYKNAVNLLSVYADFLTLIDIGHMSV